MMKAERIRLSDFFDSEKSAHKTILDTIKAGAVFVYPTETIYGIGGNAFLESVTRRIFAVKRRPTESPFILIASRSSFFTPLEPVFTMTAQYLTDMFWPGPLTLIVQCRNPPNEIALRVTDHPFIVAINDHCSVPLISTSANISGEPYNPDPDIIYDLFCHEVDFMIDAGTLPLSKPSTVIKAVSDPFVIIREGAITKEEIERGAGNGYCTTLT